MGTEHGVCSLDDFRCGYLHRGFDGNQNDPGDVTDAGFSHPRCLRVHHTVDCGRHEHASQSRFHARCILFRGSSNYQPDGIRLRNRAGHHRACSGLGPDDNRIPPEPPDGVHVHPDRSLRGGTGRASEVRFLVGLLGYDRYDNRVSGDGRFALPQILRQRRRIQRRSRRGIRSRIHTQKSPLFRTGRGLLFQVNYHIA